MASGSGLNLEKIGWISFYIGVVTIPFIPPYSLALLVFGGLVATIYHSRHK
ncbi:MAG: hypothetical protein JXQ83_14050 [Candidatus Glassbacteria bacterium]|nr:hypothetical protein [Candidatus Glassbacteria bacterium]